MGDLRNRGNRPPRRLACGLAVQHDDQEPGSADADAGGPSATAQQPAEPATRIGGPSSVHKAANDAAGAEGESRRASHKPRRKKKQKQNGPDRPVVAGVSGAIAGLLLLLVGMLGLRVVALAIGGALAIVDGALLTGRWWSLRKPRKEERARLSRYGVTMATVTVWTVCLASAPLLLHETVGIDVGFHGRHLWPWRGLALSAAALAAIVHVSAMIDWALIRLRLLGVLGDISLPCQSGRKDSSNWKLLTRVWLAHRVVAFLLGRVALPAIIGFGIAGLIIQPTSSQQPAVTAKTGAGAKKGASSASAGTESQPAAAQRRQGNGSGSSTPSPPVLAALGTIAAAILVFFINRFLPMWSLISNPRLSVGDRIVLAEEYGTGVSERPIYYVVDVAIEGIKLLQLSESGLPMAVDRMSLLQLAERGRIMTVAGNDPAREHDRSLALVDASRLLRFRGRYTGCDVTCSKAYHDCPVGFGKFVSRPPPKPDERDPPQGLTSPESTAGVTDDRTAQDPRPREDATGRDAGAGMGK